MGQLTFDGQVAIVTGAGRGLGRAHALALAERGARVIVNDVRPPVNDDGVDDTARGVVEQIKAAGGEAVVDSNSVAELEGAEAIVNTALEAFGTVDIIVHNAGIVRDKTLGKMTPPMVRDVLAVHLEGAFWLTRVAWQTMRPKGYGRIITTTSMAGYLGNFGQTNYSAAKGGLIGFTKALALEGAAHGIKANAIAPAATTGMTAGLTMPAGFDNLVPELVSPAVVALAHESCPVSGNVFAVGGGRVARVITGENEGLFRPGLTAEDVADGWGVITGTATFREVNSVEQAQNLFLQHFQDDSL